MRLIIKGVKMSKKTNEKKKTEKKNKGKSKVVNRILIALLIILLLAVVGIYFAVGYYYQDKFYSGTTINGYDCSEKSVDYIKEIIKKEAETYSLTIKERDNKQDVIQAADIKLTYKDDGELEKLLKDQNSWLWIFSLAKDKNYEVSLDNSYDEASLDTFITSLPCLVPENMTAPQDAYLEDTGEAYQIVPEVEGNTLDQEKTVKAIKDAVNGRKAEVSLEEAQCYQAPAVRQDDAALTQERDKLNALTTMQIVLDFGHGQETISRDLLKSWLKQDEAGSYYFDEPTVKQYIIDLSTVYNTKGKARDFVTTGGSTVQLTGGDYGWQLWQDKTTESLMEVLNAGQSTTMEVTWLYKAQKHDGNEIDGTYVEISISQQHMWFYKNGSLVVDTPVVTGNPNTGHATPAGGVWNLKDKRSPFTLVGKKPDGSIDYEEPVTYWLPFNGGVGIHDLVKRDAFGGDIYLSNGSHGCVNTPIDAVQMIYDNIEINTPIVVY